MVSCQKTAKQVAANFTKYESWICESILIFWLSQQHDKNSLICIEIIKRNNKFENIDFFYSWLQIYIIYRINKKLQLPFLNVICTLEKKCNELVVILTILLRDEYLSSREIIG